MTTGKNEVFIGLYPEKYYLIGRFTFGWGGGIEIWWGEYIGGIFSNGENEQISG